jgi:hypothetical protein
MWITLSCGVDLSLQSYLGFFFSFGSLLLMQATRSSNHGLAEYQPPPRTVSPCVMQIRRGCLLPHRMCCRYVKQPNRRPRSQRAALPDGPKERDKEARGADKSSPRARPRRGAATKTFWGATLRPGHTSSRPWFLIPRFPTDLCMADNHSHPPAMGAAESRSAVPIPAAAMHRQIVEQIQAAYRRYVGQTRPLRGDVDRADRKSRCGWKPTSG